MKKIITKRFPSINIFRRNTESEYFLPTICPSIFPRETGRYRSWWFAEKLR